MAMPGTKYYVVRFTVCLSELSRGAHPVWNKLKRYSESVTTLLLNSWGNLWINQYRVWQYIGYMKKY